MSERIKGWAKGLAMAVIVAFATGLLQLLVNPTEVALWTWAQWKGALILSGVFGLIALLTFVAKSPLPISSPPATNGNTIAGAKGPPADPTARQNQGQVK